MAKKTLIMSGINGTFEGAVEIKFNHRTEKKEVHNRMTHDEVTKLFSYHLIVGRVEDNDIGSVEVQANDLCLRHLDDMEKRVNAELRILADAPKVKSIEEQLTDKGYN